MGQTDGLSDGLCLFYCNDIIIELRQLFLADIILIYTICGFETAWSKLNSSPWCTLLDEESVRALEYFHDLGYYYIDGYGSEITYKQACPAFIDMVKRFA